MSTNQRGYIGKSQLVNNITFAGTSGGGKRQVIVHRSGTALALSAAQSGCLVLIPNIAVAAAISLPAFATSAGCQFDFIVSGSTAGALVAITDVGGTQVLSGVARTSAGAAASTELTTTSITTLSIAAVAKFGTRVNFVCSGAGWHFDAASNLAAGLTVA